MLFVELIFLFFTFCFQQLFSLQSTMGKKPPTKRPGAHGRKTVMGRQAKKPLMGGQANGISLRYIYLKKHLSTFMRALLDFLGRRNQTKEDILGFVSRYALRLDMYQLLGHLHSSMQNSMNEWSKLVTESKAKGEILVLTTNEKTKILPKLIGTGKYRFLNPFVPISFRRLKLLEEIKEEIRTILYGSMLLSKLQK